MKIDGRESVEDSSLPLFSLTFEVDTETEFHEGFVAINALSSLAPHRFDLVKQFRGATWRDNLKLASGTTRGNILLTRLRNETQRKVRDNKLAVPCMIPATRRQIVFLGLGLQQYAIDTQQEVLRLGTGAPVQAYTRGQEGRIALGMLETIEPQFKIPQIRLRPALGFTADIQANTLEASMGPEDTATSSNTI